MTIWLCAIIFTCPIGTVLERNPRKAIIVPTRLRRTYRYGFLSPLSAFMSTYTRQIDLAVGYKQNESSHSLFSVANGTTLILVVFQFCIILLDMRSNCFRIVSFPRIHAFYIVYYYIFLLLIAHYQKVIDLGICIYSYFFKLI